MKALSIRQPFAWAILHAGKRIENRDWGSAFRGPILLHASKWWRESEIALAMETVRECARLSGVDLKATAPPTTFRQLREQTGGIVGRARIVDLILPGGLSTSRVYPSPHAARRRHELADSPWYMGEFGFVLADVEPLPFRPLKGALGLFEVPEGDS